MGVSYLCVTLDKDNLYKKEKKKTYISHKKMLLNNVYEIVILHSFELYNPFTDPEQESVILLSLHTSWKS